MSSRFNFNDFKDQKDSSVNEKDNEISTDNKFEGSPFNLGYSQFIQNPQYENMKKEIRLQNQRQSFNPMMNNQNIPQNYLRNNNPMSNMNYTNIPPEYLFNQSQFQMNPLGEVNSVPHMQNNYMYNYPHNINQHSFPKTNQMNQGINKMNIKNSNRQMGDQMNFEQSQMYKGFLGKFENMNINPNYNESNLEMNNMNNIQPNPNYSNSKVFNSLEELMEEISSLSLTCAGYIQTQRGSREFQKILIKLAANDISKLLSEISSSLPILMNDKYGNYFCQRLIQNCSPEQRIIIIESIKNDFVDISCNAFGTHSLQVLVEISNMEKEQTLLFECIKENFVKLSCDQRGTHIVQKFILNTHENFDLNLSQILKLHFHSLIDNPHGVCVIIKFLHSSKRFFISKPENKEESKKEKEEKDILDLIIEKCLEIMQNPFGNYVIQTLLNEYMDIDRIQKILQVIHENFCSLSMQKFSSNVIENSLRLTDKEILKKILINIISSNKVSSMIKNTYGNFVLEKMIKRMDRKDREEVIKITNVKEKDKSTGIIFKLLEMNPPVVSSSLPGNIQNPNINKYSPQNNYSHFND
ncbi:MAG: hypothetical protein MJ252_25705 [archaeon]|nr:hypothetical protein [archaeon]